MHVVLVICGYHKSLINFRFDLIKALLRRGHKVVVMFPRAEDSDDTIKILSQLGVSHEVLPFSRTSPLKWFVPVLMYSIYRVMRQYKVSCVLAYTLYAILFGGFASRLLPRVKFYPLITGLGYAFTEGEERKRLITRWALLRLLRLAWSRSENLIFQNQDDLQECFRLRMVSSLNKTTVVNGSGVPLKKFPFSTMPIGGPKRVVMVARFLRDKGVFEFITASRIVKEIFPDVEFRLIGDLDRGNPSAVTEYELAQLEVEYPIVVIKNPTSVYEELVSSSIFVLPSYREGVPRASLEAMAVGRPIVTTDVPGCRETVEQRSNGLLCAPRDANSLASAVIQLLHLDENILARLGMSSRIICERKFDVRKVNKVMIRALGL